MKTIITLALIGGLAYVGYKAYNMYQSGGKYII